MNTENNTMYVLMRYLGYYDQSTVIAIARNVDSARRTAQAHHETFIQAIRYNEENECIDTDEFYEALSLYADDLGARVPLELEWLGLYAVFLDPADGKRKNRYEILEAPVVE